ncbi:MULTISPECIES: hypothetical protein [unclassified Streptosporangium]|uniref:hypothetical protein n=1 Tax=unclassified Streptosporangium TaxID=2632669 RepID=UPI002E2C68C1|nr:MULTISPECIES: hypothetical protein [unclassified Streptosporangium]
MLVDVNGEPVMHLDCARVGSAAIVALGVLVLGACSSEPPGPTVAQAEVTLKADIDWLVKSTHAKDVTVTDEGGKDIPCGEGMAKRTYGVAGVDASSVDEPVIIFNMLTGGLGRRGYKVVSVDWKTPSNESVKGESRVKITVDSSKKKRFELSGETQCLRVAL